MNKNTTLNLILFRGFNGLWLSSDFARVSVQTTNISMKIAYLNKYLHVICFNNGNNFTLAYLIPSKPSSELLIVRIGARA